VFYYRKGVEMSVTPQEAVVVLAEQLRRSLPEKRRVAAEIRRPLPALVDVLVNDFGVGRVVLFGSLARGIAHSGTDIDLAVEGLAPERYFDALFRCAQLAGRYVDLVTLEDAPRSLRLVIERNGEVLFGNP